METLLSLNHFCEIHGPQTLLSTQIQAPHSAPPPNETGTSCANCSYNVPAATTTPPVLRSRWRDTVFATSRALSNPLLRDACTRALAVETLPRGSTSGSLTLFTDLATQGPKDNRTVNVMHIFRLPDPRARGQRRVYAFVAVGAHSLFRNQVMVQQEFEAWANSIARLAERHLLAIQHEKSDGEASPGEINVVGSLRSHSSSATPSPPMSLGSAERTPPPLSPRSPPPPTTNVVPQRPPTSAPITPVSSFLSAKSVDPDGYPRSSLSMSALSNVPKTRNLAEIVGDEHFFVRLHAEFCGLLKSLMEREALEKREDFDDAEGAYRSGSDEGGAVDSDNDNDDEACIDSWD